MARARNIKPGFFKNEDLAECSLAARLCFAGLWTLADREGRLEDRPKRIKGDLFAYDSFDVEPLLQELARFKFLERYEVDGQRFIQISKFSIHQTPHYSEKPSVIKPPPLQESGGDDEGGDSGSTPRKKPPSRGGRNHLNPDSPNPDSPNPEEDSIVGATSARAPDDKKPEKPTTWEGWRAWFEEVHGIGCDPYSTQDRAKFRPLAQGWITAGVTFAQMSAAITKAQAESTEPIAYLPAYADRVLATMSAPPKQAGLSKQSALEQRNAATVKRLMEAHNLGDER